MAVAALLAFASAAAPADEAVPGRTVESVRHWLLDHNPELRALRFEAEAAAARPGPAGALPDPMLGIELEDIDRDRPRLAPDEVGQTAYRLRQRFPLWGKRGLARAAAQADADSAAGDRDAFALSALAAAERAYAEYWYAARAIEVVDRLLAVVADLETLARARYGTGLAPMQDSLKAQVERTAMQRDRIELGALRGESTAMLNAVLGRAPSDPLEDPAGAPELPVGFDYEALLARAAAANPQARAATDAARAATLRRDLTYRNRYPDVTLGVAPVQRGNRFESLDLMLELEIPLQQGTRRAQESEVRAMEAAASARAEPSPMMSMSHCTNCR